MGIAILKSRAQLGVDAPEVTIEVFLSGGLPGFSIVGMAETTVRESKDRVRGALMSAGFRFPQERITVSLGRMIRGRPTAGTQPAAFDATRRGRLRGARFSSFFGWTAGWRRAVRSARAGAWPVRRRGPAGSRC